MKVLLVAEKPSIAKAVANILGDRVSVRNTRNKYIKNYDCQYRFCNEWGDCNVTVTSVSGHLFSLDFDGNHKSWHSCLPVELFDAGIVQSVGHGMTEIHDNIAAEARKCQALMIWTDCDREGEYIGFEVATAARKANPRIQIKRANFNNLEKAHIIQAANRLLELDMKQVEAVAARSELDLRTGAAFTRLQTLNLQNCDPALAKMVISYGSCQFPTLGFVVDRWKKVQNFVPEAYWAIKVTYKRKEISVTFSWKRVNLFDRLTVVIIFEQCLATGKARVVSVLQKPKSRFKPYPLTTIELQKQGTKYLGMSSVQIMDHAEKLYQKGFISYPRTETDQFDRGMDLRALVAKQVNGNAWGEYAQGLLDGSFRQPRLGRHNDKAHPPIHPIAHVTREACASEFEHKVYTFVVRRFLACCSEDAKGEQSTVDLDWGGERFSANGLMVRERNYLDVYPYDKWESSAKLPNFVQGELIDLDTADITDGKTTTPAFLSEPELISLMDANGIGTDATMANHIDTILKREYAFKQDGNSRGLGGNGAKLFVPSTLGVAICEGYDNMGFDESLAKPHLRKESERKFSEICAGTAVKSDVLHEFIEEYRAAFLKTQRNIGLLRRAVVENLAA